MIRWVNTGFTSRLEIKTQLWLWEGAIVDTYCVIIDDVIIECLTNHLKTYIKKLGNGKKSTDFRKIGEFQTRVHYVNKSLEKLDFEGWEHIDFENSDL